MIAELGLAALWLAAALAMIFQAVVQFATSFALPPLVARVGVKLEDEQDNPLVAQRQAEQVLEVWKRSALSAYDLIVCVPSERWLRASLTS